MYIGVACLLAIALIRVSSVPFPPRAFKPMPVVLDLVYENFSKFKNLIFFMGKSGKKVFENSKKKWELEYVEKKSLTNKDSFLVNIKKIKNKK